jgi:transmembrane sensor
MSAPSPLTASQIDDLAATWVGRVDAGLTPAQTAELAAWRAADSRHAAALEKFEAVWFATDRPRNLGAATLVRQRLATREQRRRRLRSALHSGLAACLLVGVGLWLNFRTTPPAEAPAVRTAFLSPERLTLPDGSVAEFPPGTQLTVDFTGEIRRVAFATGEAHFSVAHNPARPFIVSAGGLSVRAVGTAFAVQVGADSTAVLVTAGRVSVDSTASATAAPAATLRPAPLAFVDAGQCITVIPSPTAGAPAVIPLPSAELTARLAWRERRVEFSATPLAEVIAVVNAHNRVQFSIADASLANVPLSGVFALGDPDTLARLLERGFGLTAERRSPEQIVLRSRH